jgi:hypothetical protein
MLPARAACSSRSSFSLGDHGAHRSSSNARVAPVETFAILVGVRPGDSYQS